MTTELAQLDTGSGLEIMTRPFVRKVNLIEMELPNGALRTQVVRTILSEMEALFGFALPAGYDGCPYFLDGEIPLGWSCGACFSLMSKNKHAETKENQTTMLLEACFQAYCRQVVVVPGAHNTVVQLSDDGKPVLVPTFASPQILVGDIVSDFQCLAMGEDTDFDVLLGVAWMRQFCTILDQPAEA